MDQQVYTHGLMSKFLGSMAVGDSINVRGPFGHFNYEPSSHNQVNMIACGSGITPMYQVLHSIAHNTNDTASARLLYGNKSENDIALKQELEHLATQLGESRMHITHALTEVRTSIQRRTHTHTHTHTEREREGDYNSLAQCTH
jgi:ferredoxin-NADP reductase